MKSSRTYLPRRFSRTRDSERYFPLVAILLKHRRQGKNSLLLLLLDFFFFFFFLFLFFSPYKDISFCSFNKGNWRQVGEGERNMIVWPVLLPYLHILIGIFPVSSNRRSVITELVVICMQMTWAWWTIVRSGVIALALVWHIHQVGWPYIQAAIMFPYRPFHVPSLW